jgi:hypothetical protein
MRYFRATNDFPKVTFAFDYGRYWPRPTDNFAGVIYRRRRDCARLLAGPDFFRRGLSPSGSVSASEPQTPSPMIVMWNNDGTLILSTHKITCHCSACSLIDSLNSFLVLFFTLNTLEKDLSFCPQLMFTSSEKNSWDWSLPHNDRICHLTWR